LAAGKLVWGTCDSDNPDAFIIDNSMTFAKPDPPVKGDYVNLNFGGIVTDDTAITKVHV